MSELYTETTTCRACGSSNLESALDLGNLCISDFIDEGDTEDKAPLELLVCMNCTLVQLRHTVSPDRLFKNYYYRSGLNESMVLALRDIVEDASKRVELVPGDAVLDIGANDGTMLGMFPGHTYRNGFEPSDLFYNADYYNPDIHILHEFFPPNPLPSAHFMYKVICSVAQFYNVPNPNDYVTTIKDWLHPDGIWVVQMQDLDAMLAVTGFDNICHEHITYWSRDSFELLCNKHGLVIDDISHNRTNGSSIRYTIKHGNPTPRSIPEVRAYESLFKLRSFAVRVQDIKQQTLWLLERLHSNCDTVVGMAASTKANTLLQYYGITDRLLTYIIDRNEDKHCKMTVGTHIPIFGENMLEGRQPDYLLCLAWHFFDSFVQRYSQFRGKWIVPLPSLRVVERTNAHIFQKAAQARPGN